MTDVERQDVELPGIDRRTLIKRAAATGAVAWTAPVIIGSVASPAGAITCSGTCVQVRFAPDNTGACNDPSVAVGAACPTTSPSCTGTTTVGAGVSYGALCMTAPGGGGGCSSTAAAPTFTLNATSTTCFTTTAASCPATRQFLAAQAGTNLATGAPGPCVTGVISGGNSVTFTLPTGNTWTFFQFLIGCSCA
jgi:hypothetical protein